MDVATLDDYVPAGTAVEVLTDEAAFVFRAQRCVLIRDESIQRVEPFGLRAQPALGRERHRYPLQPLDDLLYRNQDIVDAHLQRRATPAWQSQPGGDARAMGFHRVTLAWSVRHTRHREFVPTLL